MLYLNVLHLVYIILCSVLYIIDAVTVWLVVDDDTDLFQSVNSSMTEIVTIWFHIF